MKKKALAVAASGTAALALGAGLFAWSANPVNVSNVMAAGTSSVVTACTTDAINIAQGNAVFSDPDWTIGGATVTNSGVNGAQNCAGMTLTLSAFTAQDALISSGSVSGLNIDVNGNFSEQIAMGSPVAMNDLDHWTVTIG